MPMFRRLRQAKYLSILDKAARDDQPTILTENDTFAPWKVAISGFYKKISFKVVGIIERRPVVFDDTIYFLPFWSQQEAKFIAEILNSNAAKEFLTSMVFWSDKRPITINLLKRLNIRSLAFELGCEAEYQFYTSKYISNLEMETATRIDGERSLFP